MPSPAKPEPMLAVAADSIPVGEEWGYEIKWDGLRAFARTGKDGTAVVSRRGEDLVARYPELSGLAYALGGRQALLDGEIVAFDADGRPQFQQLQLRMGLANPITIQRRMVEVPVSFVAFDLLELDGDNLRELPWLERRQALMALGIDGPHWRAPAHHLGDGERFLEMVEARGLEGVVAKRTDSPYRAGRDKRWLKLRLRARQEFLVAGWLPGLGGRTKRLGSLLVGHWDRPPSDPGRQRLVYAGRVGSGLTDATIDQIGTELALSEIPDDPFEDGIGPKRADARWAEPLLVCEVEFSEWTREQTLRQPSFKGLRDDKDPREVVRET